MDAIVYDKVGKEAEKVREALYGIYPQETITDAAIASFDDGADNMPVKKLVANIEPVQDLHGYANPWPAGGGANIWDEVWELGTIGLSTGANIDDNNKIRSKNYVPIQENTSYFFRMPNNWRMVYYDENKNLLERGITYSPNIVLQSPSGAHYLRFVIDGITTYGNNASINYPATVTTYSPYSNECPISGWTGAEIEQRGANLLNPDTLRQGDYNNTYGQTRVSQNTDNRIIMTAGKTYTVGYGVISNGFFWVFRTDDNNNMVGGYITLAATTPVTYTATSADDGLRLAIVYGIQNNGSWASITPADIKSLNPYVVFGSTGAYEPYTGNQISVTFPSEAGTVYGGEDEVTTGKLKKTMGMVDLGTLTWTLVNGGSRPDFFNATLPTEVLNNNYISSMYYKKGNPYGNDEDLIVNVFNTGGNGNLLIRNTAYTTAADFKTAMSGVQLCYELAEPVEYDLTPQTMETLYGTNNIWASTGNIEKLTYRADLGKYIDSHITTAVANALNA